MAQTHSVVDWFDYGLVNLDNIMNIGAKGTFKPIPNHNPDNGNGNGNSNDGRPCCVEPIDQLDNQILDKVSCPYEDPETGMLPPNCKYNDCRECPQCTAANTYGAAPKNEEKPKKPRAKKATAKTAKTTRTKKTSKA